LKSSIDTTSRPLPTDRHNPGAVINGEFTVNGGGFGGARDRCSW
jgi:hypothetical protein